MFLSQNAGKEAAQPSKPKTQSKKAPPKKEVPKPSESEEEDDDDDEDEEEEEEDADDVDDDGKLVILSNPSSLQSKTLLLVLCHCLSFLIVVYEKKLNFLRKIICRKSEFMILSEFVTPMTPTRITKPSVIVSSLSVY